jgi:hypothetical protein
MMKCAHRIKLLACLSPVCAIDGWNGDCCCMAAPMQDSIEWWQDSIEWWQD